MFSCMDFFSYYRCIPTIFRKESSNFSTRDRTSPFQYEVFTVAIRALLLDISPKSSWATLLFFPTQAPSGSASPPYITQVSLGDASFFSTQAPSGSSSPPYITQASLGNASFFPTQAPSGRFLSVYHPGFIGQRFIFFPPRPH